jgi:hypothetical protein
MRSQRHLQQPPSKKMFRPVGDMVAGDSGDPDRFKKKKDQ